MPTAGLKIGELATRTGVSAKAIRFPNDIKTFLKKTC